MRETIRDLPFEAHPQFITADHMLSPTVWCPRGKGSNLRGGGERAPGGLPGLQNQWGYESAPAGSIPVRLR